MLSLTMNPEAERIARTAMQQAGSSAKLVVIPGDGSGSSAPSSAPAAKGSIQSHALDNPLVKQAQELFRAEVPASLTCGAGHNRPPRKAIGKDIH